MSAGNIKGLQVEIGAETKGLEAALKDIGRVSNDINKELGQIEKGLKFDPENAVLLAQKQELLKDKIENTRKGLDALRQAQERVEQMYKAGEIDAGQYRQFQREIATTESKLKTFEGQVKDVEAAQDSAAASTSNWREKLGTVAKGIGAAVAGATGALAALGARALGNADDLEKMADKTGLSAERLQELQYIGADLGVDLETIASAQAKLTKSMDAGRDGTGAQAEAFAALGISVTNADGTLRDAKTVMLEAFDALNGVGNETERDALALAIFGRGAQELNPLIVSGADGLAALAQQARDSGSVMSNEAVEGLDAFGDGMDHLKSSIMAAVGQAFAKIMPILQPILDAFLKAPGPIKILIGVIAALGVGLTVLTPILTAFTAVQWAALAPVLAVVAAIAALVAIVALCIKYHEEIKAALIAAWNAIKDAMLAAWDAIKGAAETVWGAIKDFFTGLWDGVRQAWDLIWGAIKGAFETTWNTIRDFAETVWNGIKQVAETVWNGIKLFFETIWTIIKGIFTGNFGDLQGIVDTKMAAIDQAIKRVFGAVKDFFVRIWTEIKEFFSGIWDGMKEIWETASEWIAAIPQRIKDFFVGAGTWLYDLGKDILNGLWNGLKDVWNSIADWFKGIGDSIGGFFKKALGIGSPSKVMLEIGQWTMQGFADGLRAAMPAVQDALAGAALQVSALGGGTSRSVTTNNSHTTNNNQRYLQMSVQTSPDALTGQRIATALEPFLWR